MLNSMIESGECHTTRTKEMVSNAQNGLEQLHQYNVSGMCEHPWNSVIGDGEMKPAKCLKCGKYL